MFVSIGNQFKNKEIIISLSSYQRLVILPLPVELVEQAEHLEAASLAYNN